jgi:hypothetical protein
LKETLMNPDATTAKQMLLDASKNCAFTPEGRLIAKLPPKRRFKSPAGFATERNNSDSLDEQTGRVFYPLRRSGRPHQQWKAKPSVLVPKLGFSETISDGIERFASHLHLAQAR